jgi:hypothetical protein
MKNFFYLGLFISILYACGVKQKATIVLLPDTQTYAEKFPEIVYTQTDWILKEASNIDFVLQQGDLTQNNSDKEWGIIQQAFTKLNGKVPYILAIVNHDMGSAPGKFADVRNTELFNQYFPESSMSKLPSFGATFEKNKIENAYYLTKTGKINWLILTLEFGPRNKVLDWANQIVNQHPNHLVIVNTHAYMYSDSTRQNGKDFWRAQAYGVGKDTGDDAVNDGEDIWNKLVKKHANIRFVFSGHVLNGCVGTLISVNEADYLVYQMLANYQEGVKGSVKGGNGYLRILDLDFKKKQLNVKTYSPYLNQYKNKEAQSFTIKNMLYE